jgi:hypothetical protein
MSLQILSQVKTGHEQLNNLSNGLITSKYICSNQDLALGLCSAMPLNKIIKHFPFDNEQAMLNAFFEHVSSTGTKCDWTLSELLVLRRYLAFKQTWSSVEEAVYGNIMTRTRDTLLESFSVDVVVTELGLDLDEIEKTDQTHNQNDFSGIITRHLEFMDIIRQGIDSMEDYSQLTTMLKEMTRNKKEAMSSAVLVLLDLIPCKDSSELQGTRTGVEVNQNKSQDTIQQDISETSIRLDKTKLSPVYKTMMQKYATRYRRLSHQTRRAVSVPDKGMNQNVYTQIN